MNHTNPNVLVSKNHHSLVVTLNRPAALNALDLGMVNSLLSIYPESEIDPSVSNIVLKGQGGKAFCAGGDIVKIYESGLQGTSLCSDFFRKEYTLNHLIGSLQTPHIAILNGITMGGGVGVSVHGKFRVATETTLFAMPETGIGFFPDVGGSYFLPRLAGSLGMFLGLTGYRLKGKHVAAAGVATHFVSQADLPSLEEDLSKLDNKDPKNVATVLNKYQKTADWNDSELSPHLELINQIFSLGSVEEIFSALLSSNSEFASSILQTLSKMSPTSLKVTHEQIRRGKSMSLAEALQMEFKMTGHFMKGHDFFEGVRELLVTKTKNQKWNPPTLEETDNEKVQQYFQGDQKELEFIQSRL